MNTWFWSIETINEYKISKEVIPLYLNNDIVVNALSYNDGDAISVFITKHLSVMENKWLRYHQLNKFGMDQKTISIVESANANHQVKVRIL